MPSSASFCSVLAPTPSSAPVGRPPSTLNQFWLVSRNTPAGLAKPDAILAWIRFSPMPTDESSCVAALICCWISRATASGSSVPAATKASSQPSSSVT